MKPKYISHWAIITEYTGILRKIIDEGLENHALKTTDICLKHFNNRALDEALANW